MKTKKIACSFLLFFLLTHFANCQEKDFNITSERNKDNSVTLSYSKKDPGSTYVVTTFFNFDNISKSVYKRSVKGYSSNLLKLKPLDKNRGISYSYKYIYIRGKLNPKVDSSFTYTLPFKNGKTVSAGEMTHLGKTYFKNVEPKNWKVYHFDRMHADTVCSARKGIVVSIKNNFVADTLKTYNYQQGKNEVLIEHKDGTIATYKGLDNKEIFVKVGQQVYPQTALGKLQRMDARKMYRLVFCIYFLSDGDLKNIDKETLLTHKSKYQYITPFFKTKTKRTKINVHQEYDVFSDIEIITKEFSKRELKKLKKHKISLK